MEANKYILLTIDVEDWFQVENFKPWIPFPTWSSYELRVEQNTHRILDLLDSVELAGRQEARSKKANANKQSPSLPVRPVKFLQNSEAGLTGTSQLPSFQASGHHSLPASKLSDPSRPKATFFVLAWIAKRLPHLVREIHNRGHEVASHGCNHRLINQLALDALKSELNDSKKMLEEIIGAPVYGFRAPSFSIDDETLKIIENSGYVYDSSYNSFSMHGRYGQVDLTQNPKKGIGIKIADGFHELPISNLKIMNRIIPFGGGAYFRLVPFVLFKLGVRNILKKDKAYLFYVHPWEIDPEQPKMNQISLRYKLRHYSNLDKTRSRLENFLKTFSTCKFATCRQYIDEIERGVEA